jgi:hypothetical protein
MVAFKSRVHQAGYCFLFLLSLLLPSKRLSVATQIRPDFVAQNHFTTHSASPTSLSLGSNLQPSAAPLDLDAIAPARQCSLTAANCPTSEVPPFTPNLISPTQLTPPSLWWVREQWGRSLLETWLTYPGNAQTPARVDVVVKRLQWNALDYLKQYAFTNVIGSVARDFGYNTRIFNRQQMMLASFTCNFQVTPPICKVVIHGAKGTELQR